jgi:hypothetical protein
MTTKQEQELCGLCGLASRLFVRKEWKRCQGRTQQKITNRGHVALRIIAYWMMVQIQPMMDRRMPARHDEPITTRTNVGRAKIRLYIVCPWPL